MVPPPAADTRRLAAVIGRAVRAKNNVLLLDACIEAGLGVLFTLLTFGVVFWLAFLVGFFVGHNIGLSGLEFAAIATGVFLLVSLVSAWRRVDPLSGLDQMTDRQKILTQLSLASPRMLYFSPRHASAGLAMVLLGGPMNIFGAWGTWRHRVRASRREIEAAANILRHAARGVELEQLEDPYAALVLRRLALVKVMPTTPPTLMLTEQGRDMLQRG